MIPRRKVEYRGTVLEEMDLPAILAREPEVCLIDELAHTNAPGLEHAKRYEDVEDVLDAGIDVLSTVNVQHLESLNDQVAELSGIRVRETIPDALLGRADEIVVVDLTPEELLERLRAGKVYPAERIDAALNNFFRIENLSALREVALRQVAEEVGQRRFAAATNVGSREESIASEAPQAVERAAAGAGRAIPGRATAGASRLALGAAARRRPRPALGAPAGHAQRGAGALADGAAPARVAARRAPDRRGVGRGCARRSRGSRAASAAPTS